MKNFDTEKFKFRDAASYDELTEQFDHFTARLTIPLAKRLVALAGIVGDEKVLDIGTGTGVVALEAAKSLGPGGMITGIDLSQKMLVKASMKARSSASKPKITFEQMDAERLAFADCRFDCATSLFALLHFPNPLIALAEIHRVIRPGGKLVIAIGSGIPILYGKSLKHIVEKIPYLWREFRGRQLTAPRFLNSLVEKYVPETDLPDESELAGHRTQNLNKSVLTMLKKSGFKILKTDWFGYHQVIESPEEFWEIQRTFSSIARKRLSAASEKELGAVKEEFMKKCEQVLSRSGQLVYPFGAFYVVASKP